jgi:hypothetical protein
MLDQIDAHPEQPRTNNDDHSKKTNPAGTRQKQYGRPPNQVSKALVPGATTFGLVKADETGFLSLRSVAGRGQCEARQSG